ncbi:MAG TPA: OsmC family protein [Thermoanaerobaculia bacterium]|nr:OsmC family protein [Thermoanaerobaculia bacterium]HXK66941.1 OsmC family protein [Thermoanaerobaculia bacterium]
MTKQARCIWTRNLQFVAESDSGHAVVMDTSHADGMDSASTPMELILMALMGCTGMDVVSILKKMRKEPTFFEVTCEAEWADAKPRYYETIHLHFRVSGPKVDAAALEKAIDLSREKYCSVSAQLSGRSKITSDFEILEPQTD